MSPIDALTTLGHSVEEAVDDLRHRLKERSGGYGPLDVLPYMGDGGPRHVHVTGRVLQERSGDPVLSPGHPLENLIAMYRRFESDEVPRAPVIVRVGDREEVVRTDEEGFFRVAMELDAPVGEGGWESWTAEVEPVPARGIGSARAVGGLRVEGGDADFGVISDMDDTVLRTGATSLLTAARLTLLGSATTRLPFEGAAAFYRALEAGPEGGGHNPVFYVSSSPWNLYDFLVDFLDLNGIPRGPLYLRDFGLDARGFRFGDHASHKLARAEEIMARHPGLDFVLVGDSGQHDPEIYRDVVRRHPEQVRAVYIRDVTGDAGDARVREAARVVRSHGVGMELVPDSAAAAEHAASLGLIAPGSVEEVRRERRRANGA